MKKQVSLKREHLISNIPNNWGTRKIVFWLNKKMAKSNSIYRLKIRYRKPKNGMGYGRGGSVRREDANAFSVYIRLVKPYRNNYRSYYGL